MRKIGNKVIAVLLCGGLVCNMTGCAGKEISLAGATEKKDISFSWWGTDDRHDYTMAAIEKFEEKHPDIDVHMQYTEWSGYDKKSAIQMAAGTEADVMQVNFGWLDKFSPDGKRYLDLESVKDTLKLDSYDETQLGYGRSGGGLNALPIALNSKICIYNQDLYESFGLKLPETWDDLFAAADVMKAQGIFPLDLDQSCAFMFSVAYVEQKTGKPFITDNHMNFAKEDVQEMLRFYMELVDRGVTAYIADHDDGNYAKGVSAGIAQWIKSVGDTEAALQDEKGQKTVVGKNPLMPGAARTGWYLKPATMYTISSNTKNPKEAALLLDFLVNSEEMAELQGLEKGVPVSKKARDAIKEKGMLDGIQVEGEQMMLEQNEELMSPYYEDKPLQEAFVSATSAIRFDGVSLDAAAQTAYDAMKADLG